ncbi:unknown [Clostridium sp. CAG:768]|nr:unknown [Clostridium sp. CAG:768]
MKRNGFGAISLLLGLVITAIIFLIGISTFKGVSSIKMKDSSIDSQSVQEHVDQTVNEIEQMRQQTIDYNKQMEQNDY